MTIRRARDDDLAMVELIAEQAFAPYVPRMGRKPMPMLVDYPALVESGDVWVAGAGGEVRGFCVLELHADHLLLDIVAVADAARGLGVGRSLIGFAEQQAVARGRTEVRLCTNQAMTENLGLYAYLGYRETGRDGGSGWQRVHFAKRVG